MRVKDIKDNRKFYKYEDFDVTEVLVDCIGPLIDISKIRDFRDIEYARYLTEKEISKEISLRGYSSSELQVREITKEALSHSKLAVRLIDTEMLIQLCRAKKFCTIKIFSTVSDPELFQCAKKVLIDYSKQIIRFNMEIDEEFFDELEESDFEHISDDKKELPGILLYYKKRAEARIKEKDSYRVAIDDDSLTFNIVGNSNIKIPSFQEWIGGIKENKQVERFKDVLDKRKHIYDGVEAIKDICKDNKIVLENYRTMKDYYIYDNMLKDQLEERLESIRQILDLGKARSKPICVFLAGAPGTGKSYFVNQFAKYMECASPYPVTSLSGVDSSRFYDAIEHHVEQVYNTKRDDEKARNVAFLDEIDTKCNYYAFRFLMDAMTGSRTNENGVVMKDFKSGTVENLVWFFAGSSGTTRQEFMNQLKGDERKVIDFFDRIHFDMTLPEVGNPGQAILTLMSAIKEFWGNNKPSKISIKVLLAFACTKWTSTRSIMTICRVAAAHKNEDPDVIRIELFEGIDTSEIFHKQCKYIKDHVFDETIIDIEW